MKPDATSRAFRISAGVHAAIIAGLCVFSLIQSCRPRPRRELAMFVSLQEFAPLPEETPAPPNPQPVKPDVPEPPKEPVKPKPAPVQVSTVRVTRAQAQTPPKPSPKRPQLSEAELKKLLGQGKPLGPVAPSGPAGDFPFDWYLSMVRKAMYDAWTQPGGLSSSSGLRVIVEVRVARDGTILRREVIRPSGHPAMDVSVREALDRVAGLPALPDAYQGRTRDIQIAFELTDGLF